MNYKSKYFKYKLKYLNLKKHNGGASSDSISYVMYTKSQYEAYIESFEKTLSRTDIAKGIYNKLILANNNGLSFMFAPDEIKTKFVFVAINSRTNIPLMIMSIVHIPYDLEDIRSVSDAQYHIGIHRTWQAYLIEPATLPPNSSLTFHIQAVIAIKRIRESSDLITPTYLAITPMEYMYEIIKNKINHLESFDDGDFAYDFIINREKTLNPLSFTSPELSIKYPNPTEEQIAVITGWYGIVYDSGHYVIVKNEDLLTFID